MTDISGLYQSLYHNLDLGLIAVDRSMRIVIFNKWMCAHSGITEDYAVGKELSDIFPQIHETRLISTVRDALEHGLPAIVSSIFNRTPLPLFTNSKQTDRIHQNIHVIPVTNTNNQYCIIQISDISASIGREKALEQQVQERKIVEHELRETLHKLEEASKVKGEFLASMSHEIRTPINGIIGITRLLKNTSPTEQQSDYLEIIDNSVQLLLTVINDILDYSKLEAGKLILHETEFNLNKIIIDIINMLKPVVDEKHLSIVNNSDDNLHSSYLGDDVRLKQVLLNLLSNAIKFTDSGEIKVSTQLIESKANSSLIRIEVSDSGIGIAPEVQSRLFEKFTQADSSTTRKYGGTGLGLSISKNIIELMHGSIGVESTPDIGSTFWIELELTQKTNQSVNNSNENKKTATEVKFSGNVLLVEDIIVNQLIARSFLENIGFSVVIANNGKEALDLYQEQPFTLVFMDCQMPVMDGYEATRQIRKVETGSHTPIIALTALAMKDDAQLCYDAGMDDYVTKPYELNDLISCIQKWI
ncbi:MAG: ATP-binding protein [Gammaproteobacteria bacterium]|nr:ATP-binding protein [Gammaproteobacteria bacterium]